MNLYKTLISSILLSILIWFNTTFAGQPIASINGAACSFNTIADAIAAAQPNDVINIKAGTYTQLIGEISFNLTLVASSATGCENGDSIFVTIDGMGQTFDSTGGLVKITNGAKVTFRNMALKNASAINGGIMAVVDGSSVTLDSVVVIDGSALTAGGNIYVSADTGIESTLVMNNGSIIYRGTVITGDGGGLAIYGSKLVINEGFVGFMGINEGNIASNNGGGIYAENSNLVIKNLASFIQNNTAGNSGGGIYTIDSSIDISDATINDNSTANNGGGVYLDNTNITLLNATVRDNLTTENVSNSGGGGLYLTKSSHAIVDSSTILSNTSETLGGGILSVDGTDSISVINGSDIFNNDARFGAGIFTLAPLFVDNSRIMFNTSSNSGGGISCLSCQNLSIVNSSQVSNNTASSSGGGIDIFTNIDTFVELKNSTFTGNNLTNSVSSFGGAIAQDGGTILIENSNIFNNSGAANGGGVSLLDLDAVVDSARIINSQFSNNSTTSTEENIGGGGLYLNGVSNANIIGSEFSANHSNRDGGAIIALESNLIIDESIISVNSASFEGGGIYARNSGLIIRNSSIIQNEAVESPTLIEGTFGGGGIKAFETTLELINSKVNLNFSNDVGGGIFFEGDTSNTLSIKSEYGVLPGQCLPSALGVNEYCSEVSNNNAIFGGGVMVRGSANEQGINISEVAINSNGSVPFPFFISGGVAIHIDLSNPLDTDVILENLLIVENDGVDSERPIIRVIGNVLLDLLSTTIANNTGKPIHATDENSTIVVQNSIIQQNSSGPLIGNTIPFIGLCNNSESADIGGQSFGTNLGDPQFISTLRGNYRLASTSPSLDACSFGALLDIDGNVRPNDSSNYDQGAFEMNANFVVAEIFIDGFE